MTGPVSQGLGTQAVKIGLEALQQTAAQKIAQQQDAKEDISAMDAKEAVNPLAVQKRQKTIEARKPQKTEKAKKPLRLAAIEKFQEMAGQFKKRNPELDEEILVKLRADVITDDDKKDDILRKVLSIYRDDYYSADEALAYIISTAEGDLLKEAELARQELNQLHGPSITARRNVTDQAREIAGDGLQTLYSNAKFSSEDANTLFNEYSQKYTFKEIKVISKYLRTAFASDLTLKKTEVNEKGELTLKTTEIEGPKLQDLIGKMRNLQVITNVYQTLSKRMGLIQKMYNQMEGGI